VKIRQDLKGELAHPYIALQGAQYGLIPRPFTLPVFDPLHYVKVEGEGPGEFHHVICGTVDVTESRCNSIFTFVSTVTEKLENRNKFRGEVSPTLRQMIGCFHDCRSEPFGVCWHLSYLYRYHRMQNWSCIISFGC